MNRMRIGNKIVWILVAISGFVLAGWGTGDQFVYFIIWSGFEWIRASSAGMIMLGFVMMLTAILGSKLTDRVFKLVEET